MYPIFLTRRQAVAGLVGALAAWPAYTQVADLNDAINKAGRQRMLSQRMGKAWLAMLAGIDAPHAAGVLDKSLALFDRQLVELKAYASTAALRDTYAKLDARWADMKAALVGAVPAKPAAAALLALDEQVLALAHQGTVQYEGLSNKPAGVLVNLAGRQRMLSQRMAKFYLAAAQGVGVDTAKREMAQARAEFVKGLATLRAAPETVGRARSDLDQAEQQWVFFDNALQRLNPTTPNTSHMTDVFTTSERILSLLDGLTQQYAGLKG